MPRINDPPSVDLPRKLETTEQIQKYEIHFMREKLERYLRHYRFVTQAPYDVVKLMYTDS